MKKMFFVMKEIPKGAEVLENVFEFLDTKFPGNEITTWGVYKETCKDKNLLEKHKKTWDDYFFDVKNKRILSAQEMELRFGIYPTISGCYIAH